MSRLWIDLKNNRQGVLLVAVSVVAVIVVILTMALLGYQHSSLITHGVQKNSVQALLQAHEGIGYVLKEVELHGIGWFTHYNFLLENPESAEDTPVSITAKTGAGEEVVEISVSDAAYVYDSQTGKGYYTNTTTGEERFQVKAYLEARYVGEPGSGQWEANNVTVILSQATVDKVTKTVEARLTRQSLYKYFYFFPETHKFSTGTYNGRTFGGICVNGDIILTGEPRFHYLTELRSGSNVLNEGYLKRDHFRLYHDSGSFEGEVDEYDTQQVALESSPTSPADLLEDVKYGNPYFWSDQDTEFLLGDPYSPIIREIPGKLSQFYGDDAEWFTDKYNGEPVDYDVHFDISDKNLKDLAQYEQIPGQEGAESLLLKEDPFKRIRVFYTFEGKPGESDPLQENVAFQTAFEYAQDPRYWIDWESFWRDWRGNHHDDYSSYPDLSEPRDKAERRFWCARYNIPSPSTVQYSDFDEDGYDINWKGWWKTLHFARERPGSNDEFPAIYIHPYTGRETPPDALYFLNSGQQRQALTYYLDVTYQNDLRELINDGAAPLTPIRPQIAGYKHDAFEEGGIYIVGYSTNGDADNDGDIDNDDVATVETYLNAFGIAPGEKGIALDLIYLVTGDPTLGAMLNVDDSADSEGVFDWADLEVVQGNVGSDPDYENMTNDLADLLQAEGITSESSFYNALHPARDNIAYKPSNVLTFDVNELKKLVKEHPEFEFNGIMYIDVANYQWQSTPAYNDPRAAGVMLDKGEVLPEHVGLTLVSDNTVFIKGCFNLDPDGSSGPPLFRRADDLASDPDDGNVIERVIGRKEYITKWEDLVWQPAAIISSRTINTLSDDFPEPQKMPLYNKMKEQYEAEAYGYTGEDVVDSPYYGKATATWMPSTAPGEGLDDIDDWFDLTGETRPSTWKQSWIEAYWGVWGDDRYWSFDHDGNPDTDLIYIYAQDLREELSTRVESDYHTEYEYNLNDPDPQMTNLVEEKYIYNTGIVTPYETNTDALEQWYFAGPASEEDLLVINGVFIQLPDEPAYKKPIPPASYEWTHLVNQPQSPIFNYESYFGGSNPRRPAGDLLGSVPQTWRVVSNLYFSDIEP